jgi:hypothetical protein
MTRKKSNAGGSAMSLGARFQARVSAWYCARILLQTPAIGQDFDLPATSIAERIYCETKDSIDDLRVELTGNGKIYGQCKTSLSLSSKTTSEWALVLIQFYKELEKTPVTGVERRFVLFYENTNGNLEKLSKFLKRYRQLPTGSPLIDAAYNTEEEDIPNELENLLQTLHSEDAKKNHPKLQNLVNCKEVLLRHTYIKQLRLGKNESDYFGVVDALQHGLLTNSAQIVQVLNSLHTLADDLLAERGSQDRLALRQRLQGEGVTLQDSHNYRLDFEQLQKWSATEIECQENQGRAKLIIGRKQLPITRPVVEVMLEAAKTQSFLVVGGAGTGKTGCLLTLANRLRDSGERVWYWAADSLLYHSAKEIQNCLKLQHSWMELFAEAASGTGATLIVDGLDGLRNTGAMNAYQNLFSLAIQKGIKVIASIRYFDLKYSTNLTEFFPAVPETLSLDFRHKDLNKVNHFFISDLDNNELNEVVNYFPEIQTVLVVIPQLREIIRNLFSLDLLCKLIAEGESAVQLSGISTQAELFERYWEKRVKSKHREEITKALKLLIEQMVKQQTLQVVPEQTWTTDLKEYLFSTEFIRHPHSLPGRLPESELIEFNHHLLFDYLAERLFVRLRHQNLANELTRPDTWGLFLRPSLVLFHRYAWNQGRLYFWDTLLDLERNSVSVLQKLPGYLVIAEEAICRDDLQPLLDGTIRNDKDNKHWKQIIQGVITAAQYSSLPRLFKSTSGDWWIELARDLIKTGNSQLVYVNQPILFSASNALETLSEQAKLLLNQAASALLQFSWDQGVLPSPFFRLPIECICRTISSDISASSNIIRKIISYDELQRAGYIQIFEVVSHIEDIWKADPVLAREVYDAVFGYNETSQSSTAMTPSQIFSLTSTRQQNYDLARYILTEKFPQFLSNHPTEATRALIRIIKHFYNRKENEDLQLAKHPLVAKARKRLEEQILMDEDS